MTKSKKKELRGLVIRQLDDEFAKWRNLGQVPPPRNGWLQAIRTALGMTLQHVARRLNVSHSAIQAFEKGEVEGTITLNSLKRAADALNCEFVYVLIPRVPLNEYMRQAATVKAREIVNPVSHSMALEGQATSAKYVEAQINEVAQRMIRESPGDLWS